MKTNTWERELSISIDAALTAGNEILKIYSDESVWDVCEKADRSPLTAADMAADRIIVDRLRENFPSHAILSEEEKDDLSRLENDLCFVVDPLDGTKEFLKRNGQFTVNIALAYRHESVMGVIYVPVSGELYYASRGCGAWMRVGEGEAKRLHVTDITDTARIRAVVSSTHGCAEMDGLLEENGITNIVKVGSSIKGCMVARGDAEIYYRFNPTMEWDTAAMQCIVEEAGGIFRQMDDSPMTYNRRDSLNSKGFYAVNMRGNRF